MNKIILVILLSYYLVGCATYTSTSEIIETKQKLHESKNERWGHMVGVWYGSQPLKNGGTRQQLNKRLENGTYELRFRVVKPDGEIKDSIEVGHWGMSGPIYFSIYRGWVDGGRMNPSNPADPYNYDAYEIVKLTDEVFEYRSYNSNDLFTLKKVSGEFEFPAL